MGKGPSVAPEERVNITYRPATGDAAEEVELPLRILMMGDYTLRPDDTPLEERRPIELSRDSFEEVMAAQDLRLDLSVEDRLGGEAGRELSLSLRVGRLRDLSPEGIVEQVPELRQLRELRETLVALRSPLSERPTFRKRLQRLLASEAGRSRLMRELGMGGAEEG